VSPGQLFVGFYVEHGLGPSAASAGYYPPDWIMDASWRWHRVVADLAAGRFGHTVLEATQTLGEPLRLTVLAHVPVPGASLHPPCDLLEFEAHDGSTITALRQELRTPQGFLREAAGSRTIRMLGSTLQSVPECDWVWIDVYVGHAFHCVGPHDLTALDALQLWNRMLAPFSPWLT
jgi:hypothetical protein